MIYLSTFKATSDLIVICMTIDRVRMIGNIAQVRLQSLRQEEEKFKNWSIYCQINVLSLTPEMYCHFG